jgi:hypothetical protein
VTHQRPRQFKWQHALSLIGTLIAVIQIVTTLVMWLYDDTPTATNKMQATLTALVERNQPLVGTATVFALTDAADQPLVATVFALTDAADGPPPLLSKLTATAEAPTPTP